MTKEEYLLQKQSIKDQVKRMNMVLDREYALSNNSIKLGDVVEQSDINLKIIVDKINVSYPSTITGMPGCIYSGRQLTKTGHCYKTGKVAKIWQNRVSIINGEKIK